MDKQPITETEAALKKERRGKNIRSALRFYIFLAVLVLGVLALLKSLMIPLNSWLTQYEASHSYHAEDDVYDLLFADPDWALLYDMAGVEDTKFEGRDEYVAYMEEKVGASDLDCVEVSTGLADDRLFSIRLGSEEIAVFTMVPQNGGWTLGEVEVFFERTQSVTVNIMPGDTVYINNIPLDDSYTTMTVETAVEAYLPDGLHGYRWQQQQITGLLVEPTVTVLDGNNIPVRLTRDPDTGVYSVPITNTEPITDAETALALDAAKAEALFSVRAISISALRQYFDPNSQAYADLVGAAALAENCASCAFDDSATAVTGYYRYSEDLFSVRVQLKLDVTDEEGNVQSFLTDVSYFFSPNSAGAYMVTQRLNADLQEQIVTVPQEGR